MQRRKLDPALVPLVVMAVGILLFGRYAHEPWGDETQAYLIAHNNSWRSLWHVLALEGVTPLFHVFLKIADTMMPAVWVLPTAGAAGYLLALYGTRELLRALGCNSWLSLLATVVLGTTDTFAYELGIVARPYGAGLGLATLAIARILMIRKRGDSTRAGVVVALCMLSSVHAGCVAGGAFAAHVLSSLWRWKRRELPVALVAPLVALVTAYAFIRPNPLRTTMNTAFHLPTWIEFQHLSLQAFQDAVGASGWWPRPDRFESKSNLWAPTVLAAGVAVGGLLEGRKAVRAVLRFTLATCVFSTTALLLILLCFHFGAYRHHLFLALPMLLVFFGFLLTKPLSGPSFRVRVAASVLMLPWFVHEWRTSVTDFSSDYRAIFAEASVLAPRLPPHAHIIVDGDDALAIGALLGRDDVTLRSTKNSRGNPIRYAIVDRDWLLGAPIATLLSEECSDNREHTFLIREKGSQGSVRADCLEHESIESRASLGLQPIDLFKVRCRCFVR